MIFKLLASYLEEHVGAVTLKSGGNLFINQMPADVGLVGVLLKNTYVGIGIDPDMPRLRRGKISLTVRGKDHELVERVILDAAAVLTVNGDIALGDEVILKHSRPLTEPLAYMTSISNQIEMSVNLSVIYVIVGE